MSRLENAIREIHHIDDLSTSRSRMDHIHPVAKLLVTVIYMVFVVSYDKYDLVGLLSMLFYPLCMFIVLDLSFTRCIKRIKYVFVFVFLMGIVNLFFDRQTVWEAGALRLTGGAVSMATLWIKAVFAVFSAYILMETTRVESICYALRCLKMPRVMVTVLMLTYRYLVLMLKEADRITTAYAMRAPGQKGIHMRAWGSLAGGMLLRSIDRGQRVYDSMLMRGFHEEFYLQESIDSLIPGIRYGVVWCMILLICRAVPIFGLVSRWCM